MRLPMQSGERSRRTGYTWVAEEAVPEAAQQAFELRHVNPGAAARMVRPLLEGATIPDPHALIAAAVAGFHLAPVEGVVDDLHRALRILEVRPSRVAAGRAHCWLGAAATRQADYARALAHGESALEAFTSAGDQLGVADALNVVGVIFLDLGELTHAAETLERTRRIREELGDDRGLAQCLTSLGAVQAELGEGASSLQTFREALMLARRSGAAVIEVLALSNLGYTHRERGDSEAAIECLTAALEIARRLELIQREAVIFRMLGDVYLEFAQPERALESFGLAAGAARQGGDRETEMRAEIGTGRALCLLGKEAEGIPRLELALEFARSARQLRVETAAHRSLAESYEEQGELRLALDHWKTHQNRRSAMQREGVELRARHSRQLAHLKRLLQETELQVLKAQLQPHFLFNSLHSLAALMRLRPVEAKGMLSQLADLLRLAMEQSSTPRIPLRQEVEFATAYLEVERARLGDRFSYFVDLESRAASVEVPHMLIQPLVENAIRHGFRDGEILEINVCARMDAADRLILTVRDNGAGLSPDWDTVPTGIGLRNTRLRLQQLYGAEHSFHIEAAADGGTLVEMVLPVE